MSRLRRVEAVLESLKEKPRNRHVRRYLSQEKAYEFLKALTGKDFGYNRTAWRRWLRKHKYDNEAWQEALRKLESQVMIKFIGYISSQPDRWYG